MGDNETLNTYFNPLFKSGAWRLEKLRFNASFEAYAGSTVCDADIGSHAYLEACDSASMNVRGILMEKITSTDDDYATAGKQKVVAVPINSRAQCEFAVGAGTFTTADEGKVVKFNNSLGLAVDTAGGDKASHAQINKYLTATRGICTLLTHHGAIDVA